MRTVKVAVRTATIYFEYENGDMDKIQIVHDGGRMNFSQAKELLSEKGIEADVLNIKTEKVEIDVSVELLQDELMKTQI